METTGPRSSCTSSTTARSPEVVRAAPTGGFGHVLGRRTHLGQPPLRTAHPQVHKHGPSGARSSSAQGLHGARSSGPEIEARDGGTLRVKKEHRQLGEEDATDGATPGAVGTETEDAAGALASRAIREDLDMLDPVARHAAHLAPPVASSPLVDPASAAANEPVRARSLEELIPAVERDFCTRNDRDHRAIGGISRGGFWAYSLALRHPDIFGIVGGHSAAFDTGNAPPDSNPLELALKEQAAL